MLSYANEAVSSPCSLTKNNMASRREVVLAFLEYFMIFLSLAIGLFLRTDQKVPKPYMDEIFHVPQAVQYCMGEFDQWDPMITTLPGLYITSVGFLWPLNFIVSNVCTVFWLRAVNIVFALGNIVLLKKIILAIHSDEEREDEDERYLILTIALSLLPVLYFFTFLYYTDSGSTFFILLTYLFSLREHHFRAGLAGSVAVMFRQTNIVWVVFAAASALSELVLEYVQPEKKDIPPQKLRSITFIWMCLKQIFRGLRADAAGFRLFLKESLLVLWPYLMVVAGFLTFVFINGSIVVGAKDDHQVSPHFPQLFYFCSFTVVMAFMHFITPSKLKDFVRSLYIHPIRAILFIAFAVFLVHNFTMAHKYLLSDNRHYPFYVWSKIFRRHDLVKYFLIPCYYYGAWAISESVNEQNGLWKLIFLVCISVNLVPQMLLEFRYFIIPYLILRVNMKLTSTLQIVLEIIWNVVINALTLYLFLYKPFFWPDESEPQRFMW